MHTALHVSRETGRRGAASKVLAAVIATLTPGMALAADGSWTGTTNGNWETTNRWTGNIIADGANSTATFSVDVPAAGVQVSLTTDRTIGKLVFNDTNTGSAGNWTLVSGGADPHVLTLAGSDPTITVNSMGSGAFANIALELAGTGGLTKAGNGTLVLSGNNSFTGGINIARGTLQIGNGSAGSIVSQDVALIGTGGLNLYQPTGLSLGALTISHGAGTITSTYSSGTALHSFTSFTRAAGTTGNFVINGGENGVSNAISLNGQSAGFMGTDLFFGGSNYAWYDAGGFVRGINWGVDAGSTTAAGGASLGSTDYAQTTGAITAQETATFTALSIVNTANSAQQFRLASGAVVTTNGILRSGNGGSSSTTTISQGTLQAGEDQALVLRADLSGDLLTISTPIVANGTNRLIKSGAGTVTLSGANTFTGGVSVLEGVLNAGNASAFGTGAVDVLGGIAGTSNQTIGNNFNLLGGTLRGAGILTGTINVLKNSTMNESSNSNAGTYRINGTLNVEEGVTLFFANSNGHIAINGTLTGGGTIENQNLGNFIIAGANPDFTGNFLVRRSSLWLGHDEALGEGTLTFNSASGTVGVRSSDATDRTIANPVFLSTGAAFGAAGSGSLTFTGPVNLNNAVRTFYVRSDTVFEGGITNGGITMDSSSVGTLVLAGANTYTGATTVNGGTLQLDGSITSATTVSAGALTGNGGSTTAAVTIGNGTVGTTDSFLSPGDGIGMLSIGGLLRIRGDGLFSVQIDSSSLTSDRVIANGVTLDPLAQIDLSDLADTVVAPGATFLLIDNIASTPISGTFSGLAEGQEITLGLNTFIASYVGGTGNDLVLVAVPEPGVAGLILCTLTGGLLRRGRRIAN